MRLPCSGLGQVSLTDGVGLLGKAGLVDIGKASLADGEAAFYHGIVHALAEADRGKQVFGVLQRPGKLDAPAIDQKQVRPFADRKAADIRPAQKLRAAAGGEL